MQILKIPMKHSDAILIRKLSKEPCRIHTFAAETYLGFNTGDLVCDFCGYELSKYKQVFVTTERELRYALSDLQ
jgi:hypothetical protein